MSPPRPSSSATEGSSSTGTAAFFAGCSPVGISIPGETPAEAVIRECVEETGLEVSHPASGPMMIHVDVHEAAEDHVHLDLRYLVWAPDERTGARARREPGRGMVHLGGRRCHRRRCAGRGPPVGP